ncbi:MAG: hypothetical protein ACRETY_04690 [Steroidobacteraceae bacterium]
MIARMLLAGILLAAAAGCVSRPPTIAHVHIGHAVTGVHVTPAQKGYFQQAEERAREVAEKAQAASASQDLAEIKSYAASIITATESKEQFGLKHALVMSANHITFAATSPDASLNLQQSAPVFANDIARVVERCELIALLGKDVEASASAPEATVLAGEINKLAAANLNGEDADGDGKLGSTPAEYGIAQLRVQLDALVARENPPYRTIDQWYLFNLVKLPNGRWVFDKLGRGGNIEGYQ